jgi:hypothetical protein
VPLILTSTLGNRSSQKGRKQTRSITRERRPGQGPGPKKEEAKIFPEASSSCVCLPNSTRCRSKSPRASNAGKIAVVRGRWLINGRYATQALGTRGQHDFYMLFKERMGFTRCDCCPHHLGQHKSYTDQWISSPLTHRAASLARVSRNSWLLALSFH